MNFNDINFNTISEPKFCNEIRYITHPIEQITNPFCKNINMVIKNFIDDLIENNIDKDNYIFIDNDINDWLLI